MFFFSQITVVSAITRPSTNHEETKAKTKHKVHECLRDLIWKSVPAESLILPLPKVLPLG